MPSNRLVVYFLMKTTSIREFLEFGSNIISIK